MGFVRRGGGGGGGDEGGGDEEQGAAIKRCEVCRRELLPWQDTCPDDGGSAIAPQDVQPEHDALLARLLADDDEDDPDDVGTVGDVGEADAADDPAGVGDEDVEPEPAATDDDPTWPSGEDPSIT